MAVTFGVPPQAKTESFIANYKGPLLPVTFHRTGLVHLVATHRDENALMGLEMSAQSLNVDTTVNPNRVEGTASFFTLDAKDVLQCTFSGVIHEQGEQLPQKAYVNVTFNGGVGRFQSAHGVGVVEADLYLDQGMSQGRIEATVLTY